MAAQVGNFGHQMDDKVNEDKKFVEARDLALKAQEIDPDNPGIYPAPCSICGVIVVIGRAVSVPTSHDCCLSRKIRMAYNEA